MTEPQDQAPIQSQEVDLLIRSFARPIQPELKLKVMKNLRDAQKRSLISDDLPFDQERKGRGRL